MSIVLLKKRLKRKWNQWIDPEFDGDEYAERFAFTENDSDYYERCRRIIYGRIYCLIENEDDKRDFFFRRLDVSDSCEYYVGLDDNDEFNMVLKGFVYGSKCSAIADSKTNSSFLDELKEVLGDYPVDEGGDDCDQ